MARWKVGIVGLGMVAGLFDNPGGGGPVFTHARALFAHPAMELAAVAEPDPERLRRFTKVWGEVPAFSGLEDLLEGHSLDAVYLCSPDHLHAWQIETILAAPHQPGVLLVEKPLCAGPEELERLETLLAGAGKGAPRILVNHIRRLDPAHKQLARLLRSGELGGLLEGRATYYGGWVHSAPHMVDLLDMLFGGRVHCLSARVVSQARRPEDPNLNVAFDISGATVDFTAFDEKRYQLFEMELRLEHGRVRLLDFGHDILVERVATNAAGERELKPDPENSRRALDSPMAQAARAVADILEGRCKPEDLGVDPHTAARAMRTVFDAMDMAKGKT